MIGFDRFLRLLKFGVIEVSLISRISKSGEDIGRYRNKNLVFMIRKQDIDKLFAIIKNIRMKERPLYISKIRPFVDKPVIKVITGIRRSGKSALLMLLRDFLMENGVSDKNILYINFESMEYVDIDSAKSLYSYVIEHKPDNGKYYILLDEVQNVKEWERAVNSFQVDMDCDIYITGSNSQLLSSELSTLLAGRYVEFVIETLSFKEYLSFLNSDSKDVHKEFLQYLQLGGFPVIHSHNYDVDSAYKIINDIYITLLNPITNPQ